MGRQAWALAVAAFEVKSGGWSQAGHLVFVEMTSLILLEMSSKGAVKGSPRTPVEGDGGSKS